MPKELHHDHARDVLLGKCTAKDLDAQVTEVLGAYRASKVSVFAHEVDVDVPIPLIFEVDAYTRARLPNGEIYVSMRGEAYDQAYRLQVQARLADSRPYIVTSVETLAEARELWVAGWQAVEKAGLKTTHDEERIELLAALMPASFGATLREIASRCSGGGLDGHSD